MTVPAGCNSIVPTKLTMHANGRFGEIYNKGDTVELLAHQDVCCAVSACPQGV